MGLFNKRPKETPEAPEKRAVATMSRFVNMLVECDGESINATENARLAYCVFVVGAVSAYAMKHGLEAPQAHAVSLVLFQKMGMDLTGARNWRTSASSRPRRGRGGTTRATPEWTNSSRGSSGPRGICPPTCSRRWPRRPDRHDVRRSVYAGVHTVTSSGSAKPDRRRHIFLSISLRCCSCRAACSCS
jgi:hypothetical protein